MKRRGVNTNSNSSTLAVAVHRLPWWQPFLWHYLTLTGWLRSRRPSTRPDYSLPLEQSHPPPLHHRPARQRALPTNAALASPPGRRDLTRADRDRLAFAPSRIPPPNPACAGRWRFKTLRPATAARLAGFRATVARPARTSAAALVPVAIPADRKHNPRTQRPPGHAPFTRLRLPRSVSRNRQDWQ